MRGCQVDLASATRPEVVERLRLLANREVVAARDDPQRLQLCLQPCSSRCRLDRGQVRQEVLGLVEELLPRSLRRVRAAVREHEAVDIPTESDREVGVSLSGVQRSKSAAWPWPTPTQSVARP